MEVESFPTIFHPLFFRCTVSPSILQSRSVGVHFGIPALQPPAPGAGRTRTRLSFCRHESRGIVLVIVEQFSWGLGSLPLQRASLRRRHATGPAASWGYPSRLIVLMIWNPSLRVCYIEGAKCPGGRSTEGGVYECTEILPVLHLRALSIAARCSTSSRRQRRGVALPRHSCPACA